MTLNNTILPAVSSCLGAVVAVLVIAAPADVHADEQARRFEQNSDCFRADGSDRWKGCR